MSYQEWRNKLRFGFWRPLEGQWDLGCWSKASTKPERDSNHRGQSLSTCPALSKIWSQDTSPRTICWFMRWQSPDSALVWATGGTASTHSVCLNSQHNDGWDENRVVAAGKLGYRTISSPRNSSPGVIQKERIFFLKGLVLQERLPVEYWAWLASHGLPGMSRGAVLMAKLEDILSITRNQDII